VLSGSANAGDDILVYRIGNGDSSANFFSDYFGSCYSNFNTTFITSVMTQNGDDPIALFMNNVLIDSLTYSGNPILSGVFSGDPYEDSWAYRLPDRSWLFGGEDCDVDGTFSVDSSNCPYPLCSEGPPPTYSWSNGITNGLAFSPDSTTTYIVTGTNANGCFNSDSVDITVIPLPNVIIDTSGGDLVASGGLSYLWNTGATTSTVTPDTNGLYTVVVTDINGCVATVSFNVTYINSTGILNNLISTISLYPNPVNDILNISSTDNIKSLEVKDFLGRVIYSNSKINSTNTSISTSSLSNNIYTVSCLINDKLIVKKIVISH
jgi:hypothetical protein